MFVLQETALDFWRMVVEHNVTTMVRLSGQESQSWQYWPPDTGDSKTLAFGYMTVTLLNRETRVSYVKREFKVNNTKVRYGDLFVTLSNLLCLSCLSQYLNYQIFNSQPEILQF